jgi:biotin carboxyl carrier protein
MIYYAKLRDSERKVEIGKHGSTYTVVIDGQTFTADAKMIDGPASMSIIVNKKCCDVVITRVGKTSMVSICGEEFEIELQDELEHRGLVSAAHHMELDVEEIKAPMPGLIVSIEVEKGQEVDAGSPIVIVEAMKMQNEISNLMKGRIKQILVKEGEVVESKQTLVIIENT